MRLHRAGFCCAGAVAARKLADAGRRRWRPNVFPVPFNLTSLEIGFGPEKGRELGEKLLAAYGPEQKVTILELRRNPDPQIAALELSERLLG